MQSIDNEYVSDESDGNYDRIESLCIDRGQPMPLPKTMPTNQNPRPDGPMKGDGIDGGNKEGRGNEALSAAVSDLMKRCIFVGRVTRDYQWPRTDDGTAGEEFSVKVCW